jgi:hypothetical protein
VYDARLARWDAAAQSRKGQLAMMVAVLAAMSIALSCGYLGRRRLAVAAFAAGIALATGLFLYEVYSPDYGFRMPWLQGDAGRVPPA